MAIESGTIVWLKTGSPAMTVKWQNMDKDWVCTWFDKDQVVKEHAFNAAQLTETKTDPPKKPIISPR